MGDLLVLTPAHKVVPGDHFQARDKTMRRVDHVELVLDDDRMYHLAFHCADGTHDYGYEQLVPVERLS